MTDRRGYSPGPRCREERFRCCAKDCRRFVALAGSGWALPTCVVHTEFLSAALFDQVAIVASASPFNPSAVLAAALLVKKIQTRCAQVARRGKAKRKHA